MKYALIISAVILLHTHCWAQVGKSVVFIDLQGSVMPSRETAGSEQAGFLSEKDIALLLHHYTRDASITDLTCYMYFPESGTIQRLSEVRHRQATYSCNIPPQSKLVAIHTHSGSHSRTVFVSGYNNRTSDWKRICGRREENGLSFSTEKPVLIPLSAIR